MKATKESYKQAIVDGGMNTFNQGFTVGNWGNISIRNPETNLYFIKPSGMLYPEIEVGDIVVMNENKEVVEGHRKPSVEFNFHISLMNAREDVNCVIHYHPVYSVCLELLVKIFLEFERILHIITYRINNQ